MIDAKKSAINRFLAHKSSQKSTNELISGVLSGNKADLAKAITLLESTHIPHFETATTIIHACLQAKKSAIRIGITGVPGVGKSSFIEEFGSFLVNQGKSVAVLAIDPSSNRNKGSILGDKTRMEKLSSHPLAFIRPSPSSGSLGGVANATRESVLLCEAAGFDVIIIETVGVGQSEYLVHGMVDFFLLLMLAGAGDEIQGIKRGIMEMADALFVNKADGDNVLFAKKASQAYKNALHLFPPRPDGWIPAVGTCSALKGENIAQVWETVLRFNDLMHRNGWHHKKRQDQLETWLMAQIDFALKNLFYQHPQVAKALPLLKKQVIAQEITPFAATQELITLFKA